MSKYIRYSYNRVQLKSSASAKILWGTIYFPADGTHEYKTAIANCVRLIRQFWLTESLSR